MTGQPHARVSCGDRSLDAPQTVLAVALEAYVAMDDDGRVVAWNPSAETTFGWSRSEACGRTVDSLIIPERFRAAHRAGLASVAAGGPGRVLGQRLQLRALHRDGHEFPVELTLTVTDAADGRLFHAFAHDITLAQRRRRFAAVEGAVSARLAEAGASAAAVRTVVEALSQTTGWPLVELWLVDGARQVLTCAARAGPAPSDELVLGAGLPGVVCRDARPRVLADLTHDPLAPPGAASAGLRVAIGVPITSDRQVLGALCGYGERFEDPEDSLTDLLGGVAAQVGRYLERRRAEEVAVELARTKDEFLALVTHELGNPLTVITAAAELLDTELDILTPDEQRAYVHTIADCAQRLTAVAHDLLDLARLEAGPLNVTPEPVDLCEVVRHAVDAIAGPATGKALTLTVDLPARLPLQADAGRLRQVADNLLSNAVKYTPTGGAIAVAARLEPDRKRVTWTVSDTGIGIPPAERPRLFRRFYRASTAVDRRIPGTGLGLVIARTIVERHHGTITLADHAGPGTTFAVSLPTGSPNGAS